MSDPQHRLKRQSEISLMQSSRSSRASAGRRRGGDHGRNALSPIVTRYVVGSGGSFHRGRKSMVGFVSRKWSQE